MKALSVLDVAAHCFLHVSRRFRERWVTVLLSVLLSCLWISMAGVRVSLVAGSAAAGRAACGVVSALSVRVALRVVAVLCVDDMQGTESLKTRQGSMSESSALESYANFRDFARLGLWAERRASKERTEIGPPATASGSKEVVSEKAAKTVQS